MFQYVYDWVEKVRRMELNQKGHHSFEDIHDKFGDDDDLKKKAYSKIRMMYMNAFKAEKLKSVNVIVAKIRVARFQLWVVRVLTMLLLWAVVMQIRAIGNTVSSRASSPALPSFPQPQRIYDSNGYLIIASNGGLNQMRSGICDMVAIARFLNVTMIVPQLDNTSFWNDQSQFEDIFDVNYFITSLRDEVRILKELPPEQKQRIESDSLYQMPPVSWSNMSYYYNVILPRIKTYEVLLLTKADGRLANNGIPDEVQKLRCRVNYHSLRFAPPIEALAKKIVRILRNNGPFLVLHLRYEMDMIAFSGCNEGCNDQEVEDLTRMRYAYPWWKEKEIDGVKKRKDGLCPLTPEETALALRAFDIDPNIQVYIAAGDIYGGERRLASLRQAFPNLVKKETLLPPEDLVPFMNHSNQMAALDYFVAIESDIFVPTYGGNMAKVVEGHRRYLGHKKTITIDRKALVQLTDQYKSGDLNWEDFKSGVKDAHVGRMGNPTPRLEIPGKPKDEDFFYTNPQECLPPPKSPNHEIL